MEARHCELSRRRRLGRCLEDEGTKGEGRGARGEGRGARGEGRNLTAHVVPVSVLGTCKKDKGTRGPDERNKKHDQKKEGSRRKRNLWFCFFLKFVCDHIINLLVTSGPLTTPKICSSIFFFLDKGFNLLGPSTKVFFFWKRFIRIWPLARHLRQSHLKSLIP